MVLGRVLELLILSAIMGVASYIAGSVPLKLPLSPKQINLTSYFSMGIILGTSLVLVIPEGIETLYHAAEADQMEDLPRYIGVALITGFILMYLIDHLSVILSSFNFQRKIESTGINQNESSKELFKSVFSSSLTLGLLFHAMVDGISLGSSFSRVGDKMSIELIFFVMIIIHKLPTCFSLTSILIKENLNISVVKFHLLVFAAVTPISSLITFFFMTLLKNHNDIILGNLLVFSGGTFLYVVTHVMLEMLANNHTLPQSNDSEMTLYSHQSSLNGIELLISVIGMVIPIIISSFGGH